MVKRVCSEFAGFFRIVGFYQIKRENHNDRIIMLNKSKGQDKTNRITEIDEHIRRNFEILKVKYEILTFNICYWCESYSDQYNWEPLISKELLCWPYQNALQLTICSVTLTALAALCTFQFISCCVFCLSLIGIFRQF